MQDQIEADLRGWDAIIDHRTGTSGDTETASWLAGQIRQAGAKPHIDEFPFRRRVLHECSITVGGRHASGVPLFDGGVTDAEGIVARLGGLDSDAGIALTRFDPNQSDATRALQQARTVPGAAEAIVAVASGSNIVPGLALLNAEEFEAPYGPPVLQVSTEHGGWLDDAAAAGREAMLVAHVTQSDTTACNVQAAIEGTNPTLAPLVIMTPRSAWWTCTAERGGGIAAWLACLRALATGRPQRNVIFTANTGHELGHVGLRHYLDSYPDLITRAHAWIHLGANFATAGGGVVYQASDDEFMRLGIEALDEAGATLERRVPVGQRPGGEAHNIFDGGGRYLSLLGGNRWFHHPDDRWPETIDLAKTERIVQGVLTMATRLAHV